MPRAGEDAPGDARDDEHAREHQHQGDRRAEVGLEQDQAGEDASPASRSGRQSSPSVRGGPLRARYAAAQTSSASFASSEGWNESRPEIEPALGAVDLRRDDEDGGAEAERGQDERRRELAQPPVVEARRHEHQRDAGERVDPLPLEEGDRVALPERGGRGRGAVDHHEAEGDEGQRYEHEHALLELASLRSLHPLRFSTSLLNSSPRCSKSLNWS